MEGPDTKLKLETLEEASSLVEAEGEAQAQADSYLEFRQKGSK